MGWLSVFRKHESDEHPEPSPVQAVGGVGDLSGTGVMGDPNKSVVTAVQRPAAPRLQPIGGGWRNTVAAPSGVKQDGYIIGGKYPSRDGELAYCGHEVSTVLVGGCANDHIWSWKACRECQMETLRYLKNHPPDVYMSCGHLCVDLIYSYLPTDWNFPNAGNTIYTIRGLPVD